MAPLSYRLDYSLSVGEGFVTDRLEVTARGENRSRQLSLARLPDGTWTIGAKHQGTVDLPDPGGDPAAVTGAATWAVPRSPTSCRCAVTTSTRSPARSISPRPRP
ncbi:putative glycolipid-binding domain-containing protein [Amycolatopsis thailandensis]|uniref:putative glycolipid-binding domain-containing protein n=1 Tax=Amycolatopsis thailandensis TaxID=589330 RepID=UPI001FC96D09|nr:putative glycolipid-binding domain-containing protein [Amycolatopsis thailandensis]